MIYSLSTGNSNTNHPVLFSVQRRNKALQKKKKKKIGKMVHQGSTLTWSLKILKKYDETKIKSHYFSSSSSSTAYPSNVGKQYSDIVEAYNKAQILLCKKTNISDQDWENAAKQTAFVDGAVLKSFWKTLINKDAPSDFEDSDEEE